MATKNWGDVAPPDLSLQTLNAFSGDELYRYYRFVLGNFLPLSLF
jgi:hypothetical protein